MHKYTFSESSSKTVITAITIVAVAVTLGVTGLLSYCNVNLPWWIGEPSLVGVFALTWYVFNKHTWKHLPGTPQDISGTWCGHGTSSFKDNSENERFELVVQIRQTWRNISIRTIMQNSESNSVAGAMRTDTLSQITYIYENAPDPFASDSMNKHQGVAHLRITPEADKLEGNYFNDEHRNTHGELKLEKLSADILDRETALTKWKTP